MSLKIAILQVTPFEQNCSFLICDQTQEAAIVDPGGDIPKILDAVKQLNITIKKILVTHGHLDHCSAVLELSEILQIEIYGPHKDDEFWIEQLPEQSKRFGFSEKGRAFTPSKWLIEEDKVSIGKEEFVVVHCPGHTPGHVVFINLKSRLAVVGDVIFSGSIGRTDFPRGNHQDLLDSIKNKLLPLGDDIQFIPGHGPMSSFGRERLENPYLL